MNDEQGPTTEQAPQLQLNERLATIAQSNAGQLEDFTGDAQLADKAVWDITSQVLTAVGETFPDAGVDVEASLQRVREAIDSTPHN